MSHDYYNLCQHKLLRAPSMRKHNNYGFILANFPDFSSIFSIFQCCFSVLFNEFNKYKNLFNKYTSIIKSKKIIKIKTGENSLTFPAFWAKSPNFFNIWGKIPQLLQSVQNSLIGKCFPIFPVHVGTMNNRILSMYLICIQCGKSTKNQSP